MLKINRELRRRVVEHSLYKLIQSPEAVQIFMKYHVFCVWDFQSLAKKMQQLCSVPQLPWMPTVNRESRRLMNEIILEEESDVHPNGGHCSHFELYLDAMKQAGADTSLIESFFCKLEQGDTVQVALEKIEIPHALKAFVLETFKTIETGKANEICASFTRGRETVIPDMFSKLVHSLEVEHPGNWSLFSYYLARHVEVDGDAHGPASEVLLESFCKTEEEKEAAICAAERALQARLYLWDAIELEVNKLSTVRVG